MTPGALVYQVRRRLQHGLTVAYYRDCVRPKIVKTQPVSETSSGTCEIHVLTSAQDWLNLLWALKSFYHFSSREYPLCLHDDGTLPDIARATLKQQFPQARFISRQQADQDVLPTLGAYPRCRDFRASNVLSLKLFDFPHYANHDRILLMDSDILFFAEPTELLRRIEDPKYTYNSVNADVASAYTVEPAAVRDRFGFELGPDFNSGLGLIHRRSLQLDWIEEFLSLPGILSHPWRIEQTLFALCSFRCGAQLLPEEYRVRFDGEIAGSCKHYVGPIRHFMYGRGIRHLVRTGFLKSIAA